MAAPPSTTTSLIELASDDKRSEQVTFNDLIRMVRGRSPTLRNLLDYHGGKEGILLTSSLKEVYKTWLSNNLSNAWEAPT
jgi:hypothetical protein